MECIGQSYWGRDIDMIVISKNLCIKKWSVLIDAGIHAREWIAHTSALYLIHYLTKWPEILNFFDFYIIPCLNPDGYELCHTRVSDNALYAVQT